MHTHARSSSQATSADATRPSASPVSRVNIALALLAGGLGVLLWQALIAPAPSALAQNVNGLSGMTAVGAGGDMAMLTCDGGSADVLLVLDQQAEELLVYAPRTVQSLDLRGRYSLRQLFAEARARAGSPGPAIPAPAAPAEPRPNPTR
ncbi:MAG: hypothetical protein MUE97_03600 [Phycisphaerales bacterium]|jgi:hypothetical protein|nr:hypothetical protein [Phycisphaerales bacterium]